MKMQEPLEIIQGGKAWYKPPTGPMFLGEAPIYRASDSTLHWVDVLKEPAELHILKVDPESGDPIGASRVLVLEDSVSVHYFRKGVKRSYICAFYGGVAFMDEETGRLEVLREIIPKEMRGERRFNDGGVDAKGRFWLAEIDKKVSCSLVEEEADGSRQWLMVLGGFLKAMGNRRGGFGGMIRMGACMRWRVALFVEMGWIGVRITRLASIDATRLGPITNTGKFT
jgi:sugar lactone lactonase YvrE